MNTKKAFKVLIRELTQALNLAHKEAASALEENDYAKAQNAAQKAENLNYQLNSIQKLQEIWDELLYGEATSGRRPIKRKKKPLPRGVKIPQSAFRMPILEALVELGGSGPASELFAIVEKKMQGQLQDVDYELLTDGRTVRWRSSVSWERQTLKRESLIKSDTPRGIWEISDQGRSYLQDYQKNKTS